VEGGVWWSGSGRQMALWHMEGTMAAGDGQRLVRLDW
jgi:hypothetical protein